MNHIQLFFKLFYANFKSEMQYTFSFMMSTLSTFFVTFIDVIGLVFLFDRFKLIESWSLGEVCILYGVVNASFGVVVMVARGLDTFGKHVRTGSLDMLLIRPRPLMLMILGVECKANNIGRIVNGLLPLLYGMYLEGISAPWQWGLVGYALLFSGVVFYALLLLQASLAFYNQTNIEFMNIFTYGGMQMAQFPLDIYNRWVRQFFTYIVPLGLVTYYPVSLALGRNISHAKMFSVISPLICGITLLISRYIFNVGLRRYHSTGS